MRRLPIWLLACVWATPAFAQHAASDTERRRTTLFQEATVAGAAGQWAEARDRLRAALAIRSSPKLLFSLGQAEEKLGAVASAHNDYVRALEAARAAGENEVVQAADTARAAIEPRVPHVRLTVTGAPVGSAPTATVDDQPIAIGTPVGVDPGVHRIVVTAPGRRDLTTSIAIGERQQLEVPANMEAAAEPAGVLPLAPASPAQGVTAPEPAAANGAPTSSSPLPTVGLVIAGAGLAGLAVGAGFGIEAIAKHDAAQQACPSTTCPPGPGSGLWSDSVTAGNVSTIAFIAGGALFAGGTALWLVTRRGGGAATARVGVGPGSIRIQGVW